jgi:hypothetical protein
MDGFQSLLQGESDLLLSSSRQGNEADGERSRIIGWIPTGFVANGAGSQLKHLLNRLQLDKEPFGPRRERREVLTKIEIPSAGFGVHCDSPGCALRGTQRSPLQSLNQREFSPPLAPQGLSDSHAPEQYDRHGKLWQAPRQIRWQHRDQDGMCGKCVKGGDVLTVFGENEDAGKFAFLILTRLPLKIGVQLRNSAAKRRPIMSRSKRLNPVFGY